LTNPCNYSVDKDTFSDASSTVSFSEFWYLRQEETLSIMAEMVTVFMSVSCFIISEICFNGFVIFGAFGGVVDAVFSSFSVFDGYVMYGNILLKL